MKGFSALIVIFTIVALFLLGSFLFTSNNKDVKGVSSNTESVSGISISLISRKTPWDLFEYVCRDESECINSLDSGKRISRKSGTATDGKSITISPSDSWKGYEYLKIYARPSWDVLSDGFKVISVGDVPGTKIIEVSYSSDNKNKQEVVLIPISVIENFYFKSVTFSDQN